MMMGYFLGMDIFGWAIIVVAVLLIVLIIATLFAGQLDERLQKRKFRNVMRKNAFNRVMNSRTEGH